MRPHATIFADGDPCPSSLRRRLTRGRFAIALDGAADRARKDGWTPDLIAGDLDSVSTGTLSYFRKKGVEILPTPDQDYTDLEKALAWCALRDFESIWIAQAIGGRLDHSLTNLSFLKRFHSPGRELVLWQPSERVIFLRDQKLRLVGKVARRFAVLPFPACVASSRGLAFELKDTRLELGLRESVSNHARRKTVELEIRGEALIVEGHR